MAGCISYPLLSCQQETVNNRALSADLAILNCPFSITRQTSFDKYRQFLMVLSLGHLYQISWTMKGGGFARGYSYPNATTYGVTIMIVDKTTPWNLWKSCTRLKLTLKLRAPLSIFIVHWHGKEYSKEKRHKQWKIRGPVKTKSYHTYSTCN